jgi:hypothetical protein
MMKVTAVNDLIELQSELAALQSIIANLQVKILRLEQHEGRPAVRLVEAATNDRNGRRRLN